MATIDNVQGAINLMRDEELPLAKVSIWSQMAADVTAHRIAEMIPIISKLLISPDDVLCQSNYRINTIITNWLNEFSALRSVRHFVQYTDASICVR